MKSNLRTFSEKVLHRKLDSGRYKLDSEPKMSGPLLVSLGVPLSVERLPDRPPFNTLPRSPVSRPHGSENPSRTLLGFTCEYPGRHGTRPEQDRKTGGTTLVMRYTKGRGIRGFDELLVCPGTDTNIGSRSVSLWSPTCHPGDVYRKLT